MRLTLSAIIVVAVWFVAGAVETLPSGGEWRDTEGKRINCHGGNIVKTDSLYYWYGEHRPGFESRYQKGISCYSSPDLLSWKDEGIVLEVNSDTTSTLQRGCTIERPKCVYCPATGKYVLWFHHELKGQGYAAARCAVAIADTPTGPFSLVRSGRVNPGIYPENFDPAMKGREWTESKGEWWTPDWHRAVAEGMFAERDIEGGQMSRDMTIFVDDDSKAYHIYSSEENLTLHIAELTDDYTAHSGRYVRIFPGGHNEAPVVFKRDGIYWMICSGCTGWAPNEARMFSANNIFGPWTQHPTPFEGEGKEISFGTQGAFPLEVDGEVIFVADEWHPSLLADSRYWWFPVRFRQTSISESIAIPYIQR